MYDERVIKIYQSTSGREPYTDWFYSMLDNDTQARIRQRLDKVIEGNLGDYKSLYGEKEMYKLRTLQEVTAEHLQDEEYARVYLEVAIDEYAEDQSVKFFFLSVRTVIEAREGIEQLAERTGLDYKTLHSILQGRSKPRLDTFNTLLKGLGFQLSISHNFW